MIILQPVVSYLMAAESEVSLLTMVSVADESLIPTGGTGHPYFFSSEPQDMERKLSTTTNREDTILPKRVKKLLFLFMIIVFVKIVKPLELIIDRQD